MVFEEEIKEKLIKQGANFVHFVDLSNLSVVQTKGFPVAVLFGIALSPAYLQKIIEEPDYVKDIIEAKEIGNDEFHLTEQKTDELADDVANFLRMKGHAAYSQSEDNIYLTGFYDTITIRTPLPHKTIAGVAGLGWIGKHNLMVSPKYGSAFSMCTVLTDAPLKGTSFKPIQSKCGNCKVCVDACPEHVLAGNAWELNTSRDELIDVFRCTTCLRCMVLCPWTREYVRNGTSTSH